MADKISKEKRSKNMSKIKGKNTLIELKFRKELFGRGIRYRLNYALVGKPDLVIPTRKSAVFVNGCFWHQHANCKLAYMPKSNLNFWKPKLLKNTERDAKVRNKLQQEGWNAVTVWECDIKNNLNKTVEKAINQITR